jgi:hypothetical protein
LTDTSLKHSQITGKPGVRVRRVPPWISEMDAIGSGSPQSSAASQFPTQISQQPATTSNKHLACRVRNFSRIKIFDGIEKKPMRALSFFFQHDKKTPPSQSQFKPPFAGTRSKNDRDTTWILIVWSEWLAVIRLLN